MKGRNCYSVEPSSGVPFSDGMQIVTTALHGAATPGLYLFRCAAKFLFVCVGFFCFVNKVHILGSPLLWKGLHIFVLFFFFSS